MMRNAQRYKELQPKLEQAFMADRDRAFELAAKRFPGRGLNSIRRSLAAYAIGVGEEPSTEMLQLFEEIIGGSESVIEAGRGGRLLPSGLRTELVMAVAHHEFGHGINWPIINRELGGKVDISGSDEQFALSLVSAIRAKARKHEMVIA